MGISVEKMTERAASAMRVQRMGLALERAADLATEREGGTVADEAMRFSWEGEVGKSKMARLGKRTRGWASCRVKCLGTALVITLWIVLGNARLIASIGE